MLSTLGLGLSVTNQWDIGGIYWKCLQGWSAHCQLQGEAPSKIISSYLHIENIQKLSLTIILGQEYQTYEFALECTGLQKLSERRENRCLKFGLQSLLHPENNKMFPVNPQILENPHNTRNTEHFVVNKANSESYRKSAIPYIQRMLNNYVQKQKQSQNYVNDNQYF